MFKRSTKITSLILAAASVASMVPAMAADKIAEKDGTVYKAIAYKDSKLFVDGDDLQSADDKDGVYYLDEGKYTEVDSDIDSGATINGTFGEKYVEIEDGDYYLDLTSGKVTDDELRNDAREDAASELRKKVRKDDPSRYDETIRDTVADVDNDKYNSNDSELWEVPAAPFTTPYYQVNYLKFAGDKHEFVLGDYATVYTDENGKYIDADNDLGKVNIIVNKDVDVTTDEAAAFDIEADGRVSDTESLSFDEVGDKKNKDENMQVRVRVKHVATLGSDKDYIYRVAGLNVQARMVKDAAGNKLTGLTDADYTTMEQVCFGSTKNPVKLNADDAGLFYVIQKISKEQDGDKDDAKLPKSTATYFIAENKDYRKKENEDAVTNKADDDRTVIDNETWADAYGEKFSDRDSNDVAYTVVDGKISKYQTKYDTVNDNGSADSDDEDKFVVKTFSLKSSNGFYFIDADKNDEDFDDDNEFATTVDSEGNIWKLDSGKIYKYKNDGDYELMYKCDGGLNELSVYDDNNLIAYNEDDDVYAIVAGKSSTGKYDVDTDTATTDTAVTTGWVQDAAGKWSYVKADGTKAIGWLQSPASGLWYYMDANGMMMQNGWIQDAGKWYFLKADGAMATGWQSVGGTWYFMNNSGAMQTGWVQSGSKWYYLNASGAMLKSTTVNGYVLGADGAWIK